MAGSVRGGGGEGDRAGLCLTLLTFLSKPSSPNSNVLLFISFPSIAFGLTIYVFLFNNVCAFINANLCQTYLV